MLPLRDDAPHATTPFVTYLLVGLNVVVFLFEVLLDTGARQSFIYQFGFLPVNFGHFLAGSGRVDASAALLPVFTSMFLHASWLHLIANMWALSIFGDNVEDHMGHFKFLVLYLAAGVAASLLHAAFNLDSRIPSVGASGAIAGVMGAYFLLFPSARVLTLLPWFFLVWLPAWIVLGYWFIVQFLSGAATEIATTEQTSGGGVAFWAHVGGFIAGLALIKLLPSRTRRYRFTEY
jgi:membrane associated rhomboid family serine protease